MDEDDLDGVANEKKVSSLLKQFIKIFVVNPLGFRKLINSSDMQKYALMHCEALLGLSD